MIHETKCRICDLGTNVEVADDCPVESLNKWLEMATCDRCATYRSQFYGYLEKAYQLSLCIIQASQLRREELILTVKPRMEAICKNVVKIVGDYHRRPGTYDPEFCDQIMTDPRNVKRIIWAYEKRVRKGLSNE